MCVLEIISFYFSTETHIVGTQKKRLNEKVLLSTQTYVLIAGLKKYNFTLKNLA